MEHTFFFQKTIHTIFPKTANRISARKNRYVGKEDATRAWIFRDRLRNEDRKTEKRENTSWSFLQGRNTEFESMKFFKILTANNTNDSFSDINHLDNPI